MKLFTLIALFLVGCFTVKAQDNSDQLRQATVPGKSQPNGQTAPLLKMEVPIREVPMFFGTKNLQ